MLVVLEFCTLKIHSSSSGIKPLLSSYVYSEPGVPSDHVGADSAAVVFPLSSFLTQPKLELRSGCRQSSTEMVSSIPALL